MKEIVLVGAGGCMRELIWQIQEFNRKWDGWKILGYVDKEPPAGSKDICVGNQRISYLGDDEFLLHRKTDTNLAICVGEPLLRKKIAEKLRENPYLHFPNLILESAVCSDLKIGIGCILSMDVRISTNVSIGDFVFLNIGSGICHDGQIGDYVTLGPDVRLAGNVTVGAGSSLGIGTKVIQGIRIGEETIAGAGSIIIKDMDGNCTIAGVPAKKIGG